MDANGHEGGFQAADSRGFAFIRGKRRLASWAALVVMTAGAWVMVYPYLYAVGGSFKSRREFAEDKRGLVPDRYHPRHWGRNDPALAAQRREWYPLRNYVEAVTHGRIDQYLFNSLAYASVVTAVSLCLNVLAAFAFARLRFAGRDLLFGLLLSTMMIPTAVLLVPQFFVVQRLGLVDTPLGVVLPGFAGAFGVFLLRQFFLNIPAELENAARIDGCSSWGILWHVVLPLSRPVLITLGLFTFLGAWNAFDWPLVALSKEEYYPLTVGLALFRDHNTADWPRILAASVLGTLPLIALFYAAQRFLVGGISLSGMKAQ